MSDAQHAHDAHEGHEAHEGPIKTPNQLIAAVVAAFVVPIFVIVLLVKNVGSDARVGAGVDAMGPEATAARIQPIGQVAIKLEGGPAKSGEDVFKAQCTACHTAGLAGAPKFGDSAAWAARLGTGLEALVTSALKGKGAMGAQGGGDFSDYEIARAVVYMANAAGGKFEEPKAPAPAASAP
ncbi:c-type cytochrome [Leptothrix discophora]|uniref:C-type cytochrome n=1 Tax=Leptothrix discophora TaxID=89 RepID=A0ABT9G5G0_LEPDI|nr:c-type cytochrome [Leptothrix discophora]MDP4301443.1 c-type cytochrome [Leptothrix discophora]